MDGIVSQNEGIFGLRSYEGSFEMPRHSGLGEAGATIDDHVLVQGIGGPVTFAFAGCAPEGR